MNAPEALPSSLEDFVLEVTSLGVPVRAGSAQGPLKALASQSSLRCCRSPLSSRNSCPQIPLPGNALSFGEQGLDDPSCLALLLSLGK